VQSIQLFKGGNFRPAAARYHKALTHCAKFFDLSPEDEKEVSQLKLSLYLNLAQCYIKLDNWEQVRHKYPLPSPTYKHTVTFTIILHYNALTIPGTL
jgi:tetratricopeptide (TPR) repeat protein